MSALDEGKALELIHTCLKDLVVESQILRCTHVDLLCVQSFPEDRPTMSSANFMLQNGDSTFLTRKSHVSLPKRVRTQIQLHRIMHSYNAATITILGEREKFLIYLGNKNMRSRFASLLNLLVFPFLAFQVINGANTIEKGQPITYPNTIISVGGRFELGFFSPGNTSKYYVGIWHKVSNRSIVWVANREYPFPGQSLNLSISDDGKLVISDDRTVYDVTGGITNRNTYAQLLDSGNLALLDHGSLQVLWESFKDETNTILPGMTLQDDRLFGHNGLLVSWKTSEDPAPGSFSLELRDWILLIKKGFKTYWTDNRNLFLSFDLSRQGYWKFPNTSEVTQIVLDEFGQLKLQSWSEDDQRWHTLESSMCPYHQCGVFSICSITAETPCSCLEGFEPIKNGESEGCMRKADLQCSTEEVQVQIDGRKKRSLEFVKKNKSKLQLFSFASVSAATDKFSVENKLGEGGFGPVYKGVLLKGHEIAVKRLSRRSGQGWEELKNEALVIAKLQHKNLVRLLGCCLERDEKIPIYEYMPNKSLDFFLFDLVKRWVLDWETRVRITEGIVQGLLYLHQYSRLRIIHRDLKASNILLDSNMNPKISDFGMARIFLGEELQANTTRVVGTYGYMAPEYALEGLFSVKSDVFSFGVLLLEIVSGKKNTGFYQSNSLQLLAHAWSLWTSNSPVDLVDPTLEKMPTHLAIRYVNIGLLCVKEIADDRPTMSDVFSMLTNESSVLLSPKQPAFFNATRMTKDMAKQSRSEICSVNDVTFSVLDAR
ncbi:receptor-like serine/threonine-protein kinase SD1-6 [Hibiscus syriacus]|uniref:receptor-like serine/threonine-protein kinase SD1-6 n=1 Tax=Hibiscus syriacus TaxID=106335 RepID=UPI0019240401|nr:receptor-like serine/threonine-protein kinase SD1-6 [Hibiscus syriacus]